MAAAKFTREDQMLRWSLNNGCFTGPRVASKLGVAVDLSKERVDGEYRSRRFLLLVA